MENRIDRQKDLTTITDIAELETYLNAMFEEISKTHPRYPEYGYTWSNGEIIEITR